MNASSPTKRRALATLNANAMSPVPKTLGKPALPKSPSSITIAGDGRKRPLETSSHYVDVASKKTCAEPRRTQDVERDEVR